MSRSRMNWNGKGVGQHGDKTTTGAICRTDYDGWIEEGARLLRVGDKTTPCPVCKQIGEIKEGDSTLNLDGKFGAIDRALVHCGCPPGSNRLIAPLKPGASIPIEKLGSNKPVETIKRPEPTVTITAQEKSKTEPIEPGFCIVHLPATVSDYGNWLLMNAPEGARELYDQFNLINRSNVIKSGSILLLIDPKRKNQQREVTDLLNAQVRIDNALAPLTDEEANFLHRHYAFFQSLAAYGSPIVGKSSEFLKQAMEKIKDALEELEEVYKTSYTKYGNLQNEYFYAERSKIFTNIKGWTNKLLRQKLDFADYDDMKKALKLSTKSIIHKWDKVGTREIEGYATHIEKAAKYVKMLGVGTNLGLGLEVAGDTDKIYDACSQGRECKKTSLSTGFEFVGGIIGGIGAKKFIAGAAEKAATPLCVLAVSLASGGSLAVPADLWCPIIVNGVVILGGEVTGGNFGEWLGDITSEATDYHDGDKK